MKHELRILNISCGSFIAMRPNACGYSHATYDARAADVALRGMMYATITCDTKCIILL